MTERPERLHLLDPEQIRDLLVTGTDGHLALTERALPVVVPAVYQVEGDGLIVWAGPGLSPRAPGAREVAAFQTGAHAPNAMSAWNVLVQGRAHALAHRAPRAPVPIAVRVWEPSGVFQMDMDLLTGWMIGDADVGSFADGA